MQTAFDLDGHCPGPLFGPMILRPASKRQGTRLPGQLRRRAERQATPAWADRAATRAKFQEAKRLTRETGVVHSVDHVVPLSHPLVCGLHVAENLRVLTLAENVRKGNLFWPDGPGEQSALPFE